MWSENNRDAEYTIASRDQDFNKWNYNNKDVSVQNNRYVRVKSLLVGYSLPQKWISKAGLSKLRVYSVSYTHLDVYKRQVPQLRSNMIFSCLYYQNEYYIGTYGLSLIHI